MNEIRKWSVNYLYGERGNKKGRKVFSDFESAKKFYQDIKGFYECKLRYQADNGNWYTSWLTGKI